MSGAPGRNEEEATTMCRLFAALPLSAFTSETRSVRLGGHATSIRLEQAFWAILDEIAAKQGVSLAKFLTKLHDEVLENVEARHNFSSLLRCACLTYVVDVRDKPAVEFKLNAEARRDFAAAPVMGERLPAAPACE
jgi:predicted DNA-binding ribbon-helix-helix protein